MGKQIIGQGDLFPSQAIFKVVGGEPNMAEELVHKVSVNLGKLRARVDIGKINLVEEDSG